MQLIPYTRLDLIKNFFCIGILYLLSSCMHQDDGVVRIGSGEVVNVTDDAVSLLPRPSKLKLERNLKKYREEYGESKSKESLINIIDTLFLLRKYSDMVKFGKKALLSNPKDTDLKLKIAHAAIRLRKYSYAEFILQQINCRQNSKCQNLLGVISYLQNQILDSLKFFKKSVQLDSENLMAALNLAILNIEFNKFSEAHKVIGDLLREDSKNYDALTHRAILLRYQGKIDNAEDMLDDLLERDPGNPLLLHNASAVLAKLGEYEDAYKMVLLSIKNAGKYRFNTSSTVKLKRDIELKMKANP